MENVADIYPLSPLQEGMLFHTLAAPEPGVYVEQYCCKIRGPLDVTAFRAVWQSVVDRHPILRTAFLWEGLDEALQIVRHATELPWTYLDWQSLTSDGAKSRLRSLLEADRRRGFDPAQAPLLRITLVCLDRLEHQLIWSFHHLLSDGWSVALLLKEVFSVYAAHSRGEALPLHQPRPYRDYIAWLQQQDLAAAEVFWREQLQGLSSPTPLRIDRSGDRSIGTTNRYEQQQAVLTTDASGSIQGFARQHRLTLNTVLQGAWSLLLSRYSGEATVVYGTTVSGRPAALQGVEDMIGPFINTLPMRVDIPGTATLLPWLAALQRRLLAVRQYEYTPLIKIQQWSDRAAGQPLFESILVFENYPLETTSPARKAGLIVDDVRYLEQSNYPLALLVVPDAQVRLIAVYDTGRFEPDAIKRLLGHLQHVLDAFTAAPNAPLSEYGILTEAERHEMLVQWNDTRGEHQSVACIHHLFEARAAETPDAVAVVFGGHVLTYGDLDRRASRLASRLRSLGVDRDVRVGLCVDPSPELVIGFLGILKAGGAYVPLDPGYPNELLRFMLDDTEAPVILTKQDLAPSLPATRAHVHFLDVDAADQNSASAPSFSDRAAPDDLAYVIFTSGSAGQPKGVLVSHRNVVHSTVARIRFYGEPPGRFLLLSSFSFDSSVAGLFWPLCTGGTLVLSPPRLEQDMEQLTHLIAQHQVTHTLCLPSLYSLILEHGQPEQLSSLRTVIVAGEVCPASLGARHHASLPQTRLYNEYGPTEATVWSTVYEIPARLDRPRVPIGRPIADVSIYLLDPYRQPVPVGVPGEVYIGGAGVARGYHMRPALTAERFIPDPFNNGQDARLYRTGDLARYLADGTLEFLGRTDNQVKVRGHRIELGEIEAALQDHPAVRETVVIARGARAGESERAEHHLQDEIEIVHRHLMELTEYEADRLLDDIERLSEEEASLATPNSSDAQHVAAQSHPFFADDQML